MRLTTAGPHAGGNREDGDLAGGSLAGVVTECTYTGDRLRYRVEAEGRDFRVEVPTGTAAAIGAGQHVRATWAADDAWVVSAPETA